jgi:hypothetical protein
MDVRQASGLSKAAQALAKEGKVTDAQLKAASTDLKAVYDVYLKHKGESPGLQPCHA